LEEAPVPASIDELRPGGQGIRLLKKFAGSLAYQRLDGANRLTIRFAIPRRPPGGGGGDGGGFAAPSR
jgi:anti-sigma regulatory factor (Ser/Thr protein kinase)